MFVFPLLTKQADGVVRELPPVGLTSGIAEVIPCDEGKEFGETIA